jgi:CDP-paratose 2-epimerase
VTRDYRTIVVTGGAGFVGSNVAVGLAAQWPSSRVVAADNLRRRGSELTLNRLRQHGVHFVHADVRNPEDLAFGDLDVDLVVDCAAEPSVLAAYGGDADYVINTNLLGSVHCFQLARRTGADVVFLSTSRVYPIDPLNAVRVQEGELRFTIAPEQSLPGVSGHGVAEEFPLDGTRSLYGATKLAAELILQEFAELYKLRFVTNRCGVITGPWQMAKADQGVFTLWVAHHYFNKPLRYIGWGGTGKQVRDLLHVEDLCDLLVRQLLAFDRHAGRTYNVGGGPECSLSLAEATRLCQELTGTRVPIEGVAENRPGDVRLYLTDYRRVAQEAGWRPAHTAQDTLASVLQWVRGNEADVRNLWGW